MRNITRASVALVAAVALTGVTAMSASAADVNQTVTGGEYSASASDITLGAIATSHTVATNSGTLTLNVDDSTGSGAGWNVTQILTDLAPTAAMTTAGATSIPATGITVTVGTVASSAGQGITDITPSAVVALDTDVKVLSALAQTGMGTYTAGVALDVVVPANTYAGTYTGTLTTTISTAP